MQRSEIVDEEQLLDSPVLRLQAQVQSPSAQKLNILSLQKTYAGGSLDSILYEV